MCDVMIFGGTTEGRLLAEYCDAKKISAVVCVVSDYGQQVLPESPWLNISRQAMTRDEMAHMIRREVPRLVLDATHPYASVVTGNVAGACQDTGTAYVRISREATRDGDRIGAESTVWVDSVEAAVDYLMTVEGKVLVTTGSKELGAYTRLSEYGERLYVRVLPDSGALHSCESLGIRGSHVIGMQGPFSKELNVAMLSHTGAAYLVTKEAGAAGGFLEKLEAAGECGVIPVVIGRPNKPEGISVEEGKTLIRSIAKTDETSFVPVCMNLVGIGMGGSGQLTLEAAEVLKHSNIVFGAPRMLRSIEAVIGAVKTVPYYRNEDVLGWLARHDGYGRVSVVYSGDTGFYSGANGLLRELERTTEGRGMEVSVYPGISTVSYLCSKLQISWEDAYLASAHGRQPEVRKLMEGHEKVFLLLGGADSVKKLCLELVQSGYPGALVSVGERLSYEEERIVTGRADSLLEEDFDPLAAVLLRR